MLHWRGLFADEHLDLNNSQIQFPHALFSEQNPLYQY